MDTRIKNITLCVIVAHLLFLFCLSYMDTHVLFKKKSIKVSTISYQEKNIAVTREDIEENISTMSPKIAAVKKETPAVFKKNIKPVKKDKIIVSKKTRNIQEEHEKEALSKDISQVLSSLQKNTKKIESKKSSNYFPSFMATVEKNQDRENSPFDLNFSYQDLLIAELKNSLNLPDFGEVKITITITPQGKITKLKVLSTKSKKNEEYLKNTLPKLTLSWFNQYAKDKPITLTITFKNEI